MNNVCVKITRLYYWKTEVYIHHLLQYQSKLLLIIISSKSCALAIAITTCSYRETEIIELVFGKNFHVYPFIFI